MPWADDSEFIMHIDKGIIESVPEKDNGCFIFRQTLKTATENVALLMFY